MDLTSSSPTVIYFCHLMFTVLSMLSMMLMMLRIFVLSNLLKSIKILLFCSYLTKICQNIVSLVITSQQDGQNLFIEVG